MFTQYLWKFIIDWSLGDLYAKSLDFWLSLKKAFQKVTTDQFSGRILQNKYWSNFGQ